MVDGSDDWTVWAVDGTDGAFEVDYDPVVSDVCVDACSGPVGGCTVGDDAYCDPAGVITSGVV